MKHFARLPAAGLAVALFLTTAAQALTPTQALELLDQYYLDPLPEAAFHQTDVAGIIRTLNDPYTQYFTSEEYNAFLSSLTDTEQVGAGISIQLTDGGLLVLQVLPGSAAEAGGLEAGDIITAIDGRSLEGLDLNQAASLLTGQAGTSFQVTYLRDGESHTVTLTRRAFVVLTAHSELWEDHIGYLSCSAFGPETAGHVQEGLETYASQADHWIMDLRGNGGGEVNAALNTLSYFTGPSDRFIYMLSRGGTVIAQGSQSSQLTDAPLIVLTDGNSASASELFASVIRDTGSGLLVGGRTYGKGVAQIIINGGTNPAYFPDGDALKLTAYRFFSPAGTSNDTIGVMPHLLLDPSLSEEAAVLLSSPEPQGDTSGTLRIDLNGAWYIDLDQACSDSYRAVFTALLEALPDGVLLRQGTGTGWASTTAASVAASCGLSDYVHRGFSDTAQSPYADEIGLLATYGVVLGGGDGTYHPAESLTRGQLCTLLAQALNCNLATGESAFTDVSMDAWYGPAVNALAALGLVNGVGGGRFAPDDPVSHEQFITILARLGLRLDLELIQTWKDRPEEATAGYDTYASWAWESVWLMDQGNESLLWAPPAEIQPSGVTTREEAAALTCSLLCRLNLLPDLV